MKQTILFVDDEKNILYCLKRIFRNDDYHILTAESGHEALDIIKNIKVDMVVSDYRMPKMSGIQLLQKVKTLNPYIIRIVLSGYADAEAVIDAIENKEIHRFFTKPWDEEMLKNEIRQCFINNVKMSEARENSYSSKASLNNSNDNSFQGL